MVAQTAHRGERLEPKWLRTDAICVCNGDGDVCDDDGGGDVMMVAAMVVMVLGSLA